MMQLKMTKITTNIGQKQVDCLSYDPDLIFFVVYLEERLPPFEGDQFQPLSLSLLSIIEK